MYMHAHTQSLTSLLGVDCNPALATTRGANDKMRTMSVQITNKHNVCTIFLLQLWGKLLCMYEENLWDGEFWCSSFFWFTYVGQLNIHRARRKGLQILKTNRTGIVQPFKIVLHNLTTTTDMLQLKYCNWQATAEIIDIFLVETFRQLDSTPSCGSIW